jgi:hypothetical protein
MKKNIMANEIAGFDGLNIFSLGIWSVLTV